MFNSGHEKLRKGMQMLASVGMPYGVFHITFLSIALMLLSVSQMHVIV